MVKAIEGTVLAEVSRRLVQLHKECFGRGPTKARSFLSDDVLVCLLEGGFMPIERTLRDHGRPDLVSGTREAVQHVLRDRFIEAIEEITERKVQAFMTATEDDMELTAEIFVLEREQPAEPELGPERAAVSGWA